MAARDAAWEALRDEFALPPASMENLRQLFLTEARAGLAGSDSSLRMLPTYLTRRVTGEETGEYFALDLGGTHFRVLQLRLEGGGRIGPVRQRQFKVPDAAKRGSGAELFGFLADCVSAFVAAECGGEAAGDIGFTFSFPAAQTAIDAGTLVAWNKGFAAADAIGADVVALLQAQLEARGLKMRVTALANDTVGTMAAAAYSCPGTAMGVIFGTGTNAAYVEQAAKIGKGRGVEDGSRETEMAINTEWGNLDTAAVRNEHDAAVDAASENPGLQRFEKMVSGMYLGELLRTALAAPAVRAGFSRTCAAGFDAAFSERFSLHTSSLAAIEADATPDLAEVAHLLAEAGVQGTLADRSLLRDACAAVSTRAALLAAVGIASLLELAQSEPGPATVAVDGTVFERYPGFQARMEGGLEMLLGPERARDVSLVLTKDGSGVGAAIIAAAAAQARGETQ